MVRHEGDTKKLLSLKDYSSSENVSSPLLEQWVAAISIALFVMCRLAELNEGSNTFSDRLIELNEGWNPFIDRLTAFSEGSSAFSDRLSSFSGGSYTFSERLIEFNSVDELVEIGIADA